MAVRMALNSHCKNQGAGWSPRVDALMQLCKINTIAKISKLRIDVREQGASSTQGLRGTWRRDRGANWIQRRVQNWCSSFVSRIATRATEAIAHPPVLREQEPTGSHFVTGNAAV